MNRSIVDMTTDSAWEEWGRRDPYFGVITDPKFRRSSINERSKQEFFESGLSHVRYVIATIQKYIDPNFVPRTILDFGCGVGRLLIPFAMVAENVVGLDVSVSMLREARKNCNERGLRNVHLSPSDDELSTVAGTFDLIHSCIVFQHIPKERGRAIFSKLLRHVRPGGMGAIQLTYSKSHFSGTHGVAPTPSPKPDRIAGADADPEIQMNCYNMTEIMYLMQSQGVNQFHAEFSDHGGELGVFLFFSVANPTV
jgi:ubiquinone/menaquinone biosynthesis C-methylase UbiE